MSSRLARALAAARDGLLAVVVAGRGGLDVLVARMPPLRVSYADRNLKVDGVLLHVAERAGVGALTVR